jgi:hypothetical protein
MLPRADSFYPRRCVESWMSHGVMRTLLFLLTALGSGLCWWPVIVEPNLDLPSWIPLASAAVSTGLSTTLHRARWPLFLLASGLGTFGGLCVAYMIWWPTDPIAGTWVPYSVAAVTLAAVFVSLVAALAARKVVISHATWQRAVWVLLSGCVAFGPVALALTPPLVRQRTSRNDRLAAERFTSLKQAVERAAADTPHSGQLCDGRGLERYYSGPSFSEDDWRRITGNYIKQDGYFFMVYCREKGGYTIDVRPARPQGDGTRSFCTDESGRVGCRMEWDRSRHRCMPCRN